MYIYFNFRIRDKVLVLTDNTFSDKNTIMIKYRFKIEFLRKVCAKFFHTAYLN